MVKFKRTVLVCVLLIASSLAAPHTTLDDGRHTLVNAYEAKLNAS